MCPSELFADQRPPTSSPRATKAAETEVGAPCGIETKTIVAAGYIPAHFGAPDSIHFLTIAMSVALSGAFGGMFTDATPGLASPTVPFAISLYR